MWEVCDECGEEVNRWYDMGTSYICDECLKNHLVEPCTSITVENGKITAEPICDFCNDPNPFWLYKVGTIYICDQCIRFYERGMR